MVSKLSKNKNRDVELEPLDKWLIETYPELQDEEYFFIEIDY